MAADHIQFGLRGEQLAVDFISQQGAQVLERNFRWSRAEIDIIAKVDGKLHFIEVKTRHWQDLDAATDALTPKQQDRIMTASSRFMDDNKYTGDFQYDIIVVLIDVAERVKVIWRKDAFGFFN